MPGRQCFPGFLKIQILVVDRGISDSKETGLIRRDGSHLISVHIRDGRDDVTATIQFLEAGIDELIAHTKVHRGGTVHLEVADDLRLAFRRFLAAGSKDNQQGRKNNVYVLFHIR